jgi:hypothetical protein
MRIFCSTLDLMDVVFQALSAYNPTMDRNRRQIKFRTKQNDKGCVVFSSYYVDLLHIDYVKRIYLCVGNSKRWCLDYNAEHPRMSPEQSQYYIARCILRNIP